MCKNASTVGNGIIKRRIRESGVARKVQPFKDVKPEDCTYAGIEELFIREEMEPDQEQAVCLNYNDSDTAMYRGDWFDTTFYRISTRKFTKNVWQLASYKNNLREIVMGNMLKDIHTAEDVQWFKGLDQIVGSPTGVGASGVQQNFEILGRISRANYADNLRHLLDRDLNNAIFVTNRITPLDWLKLNRDEIGGDKCEDLLIKGLEALTEYSFFGIPHIATIKKTLVPDNVIYKFAESDYLGRAYRLQDIKTYIKREEHTIVMHADEFIGVSIPNVNAKGQELPDTAEWTNSAFLIMVLIFERSICSMAFSESSRNRHCSESTRRLDRSRMNGEKRGSRNTSRHTINARCARVRNQPAGLSLCPSGRRNSSRPLRPI